MSTLRAKVIRLAHDKPELRPHLLPLLERKASTDAEIVEDDFYTMHESDYPGSAITIEGLDFDAGWKLQDWLNRRLQRKGLEAEWNDDEWLEVYPRGAKEGRYDRLYESKDFDAWKRTHREMLRLVEQGLNAL